MKLVRTFSKVSIYIENYARAAFHWEKLGTKKRKCNDTIHRAKRSGAKNHTVLLSRAIMQANRQWARASSCIVLRIHAHGQHGVTTGAGNAYQQPQTISYWATCVENEETQSLPIVNDKSITRHREKINNFLIDHFVWNWFSMKNDLQFESWRMSSYL